MSLTLEEIHEYANELDRESKALKKELFKMCWFMRGGITIEQAYNLDYEDRQIISAIIESNLETTKETKLPFF